MALVVSLDAFVIQERYREMRILVEGQFGIFVDKLPGRNAQLAAQPKHVVRLQDYPVAGGEIFTAGVGPFAGKPEAILRTQEFLMDHPLDSAAFTISLFEPVVFQKIFRIAYMQNRSFGPWFQGFYRRGQMLHCRVNGPVSGGDKSAVHRGTGSIIQILLKFICRKNKHGNKRIFQRLPMQLWRRD